MGKAMYKPWHSGCALALSSSKCFPVAERVEKERQQKTVMYVCVCVCVEQMIRTNLKEAHESLKYQFLQE